MIRKLPSPQSNSRVIAVLAVSAAFFLLLTGVMLIPGMLKGRSHEGTWQLDTDGYSRGIELPFFLPVRETTTVTLTTSLNFSPGESLCFLGLNVTAVSAELDGQTIFRAGEHGEPTANLWNSMLVFRLPDEAEGGERLTITATGNQLIALERQPFYMEHSRALRLEALQSFLYHDLLVFFMGGSVVAGVLLISFAGRYGGDRFGGLLLGISCILAALYAFDFTFRISTGSYGVYNILKRLMVASGYLASFTYTAGLEYHRRHHWRISRWSAIPTAAIIAAVFIAPTLGVLHRWFPVLNIILLTNLILVVIIVFRGRWTESLFLFAAALIVLGLLQLTIALAFKLPMPTVIQYVVVIVSIPFGVQFMLNQRRVAEERDNLRLAYERDPLTDAYNRRALDDVNLTRYSAAAFMDLDEFKGYNDRYGHERGDELLREFVSLSRSLLRKGDVIIRYGGDEFLILFKESEDDEARGAVERIRRELRDRTGNDRVDLSYGIESIGSDGRLDMKELDRLMYSMKEDRKKG